MPADSSITRSSDHAVAEFLDQVAEHPVLPEALGRLIFALDATASRQPAWDRACQLQAEMFLEANRIGRLEIQLAWYRGLGEFDASDWVRDGKTLLDIMGRIYCIGGLTQIGRLLAHALREAARKRVNTLVFVGDCVEENPDELFSLAGQLGVIGIPMLIFHEGGEPHAGRIFRELARLSCGAYCSFDANSAAELRTLLNAAAVYAVGGKAALEDFGCHRGHSVRGLLEQL